MAQPKLRFKREDGTEYPEWEKGQFGATVLIERGGSPRPIKQFITNGEGYNWVKISDAPKYGKYITQTAEKIKKSGLDKTRQVFKGDLILSNSMSFGKPYIMAIDGCIHDGWLLVRNNQNIYDLIYLCYLLGTDYMLKQYKSLAGGSTVDNLNKELVSTTTVFIPCLEEQQKIAGFLSTVDEVITQSEAEVQNLEQQKKATMQKIFSQEVRFKREDGTEFPEWVKIKLENAVDFLDEKRKPITSKYRNKGQYPYYGASGIIDYIDDYIFDEELVLLSEDGANIVDRNYRVSFIATGKYWVNNHAHCLRAKKGFSNYFLSEALENIDYTVYNTGSAQPKLNQEMCRNLPLICPCLEEQQKIADLLSAYDEAIACAKQELNKWKELKKGLLQQLFL